MRELLRAVVDTNVWISAFINPHGAPQRLLLAARMHDILGVPSV